MIFSLKKIKPSSEGGGLEKKRKKEK